MFERILDILLVGITKEEFVAFYLLGTGGIIIRFLVDLWYGVRLDTSTPYKFQWPYFLKGFIRVIISLLALAMIIARFQDYSSIFVGIDFPVPTRVAEGTDPVSTLKAGGAVGLGLAMDEILKKMVGLGGRAIKRI